MNQGPVLPVVPKANRIQVTYDATADRLSKARGFIPQPNVTTPQTSELHNFVNKKETQLKDLKVEADALEEELRVSQPSVITVLKRFLLINPQRRFIRRMKLIKETGDAIENAARHTRIRRKTVEGLFDILDTHDLPQEIESLGKASDYPFSIVEIRKLQKPAQSDEVQKIHTEALIGSDLSMREYDQIRKKYMISVQKAINLFIDAMALEEDTITNRLAQLSHWVCFVVTRIGYHMGKRPKDLDFVSQLIPRVTRVIDSLRELLVIKAIVNNLHTFEDDLSNLHSDIAKLSASIEERMKLPPWTYKVEENNDLIVLSMENGDLTYKKSELTVMFMCEQVLTDLKIALLEGCHKHAYHEKGGSFGKVYKGDYCGKAMAFKEVKKSSRVTVIRQCLRYLRELYIWKLTSDGPYIQGLEGIYIDPGSEWLPALVSPWCSDGTLRDYLQQVGKDQHAVQLELARQVSVGLEYLHSKKVVHGDLRTDNVLVHDGTVRLSDFGISRLLDGAHGLSTDVHGNPCWTAPEILSGESQASYEADVFSFGRLLFSALTRTDPYADFFPAETTDQNKVRSYVTTTPARHPTECTKIPGPDKQNYTSLMHRCWEMDKTVRPSSTQVVKEMTDFVEKCKKHQC